MANGIDVSKYQGKIDWTKASAKLGMGGFAYIRALDDDGLAIDPQFAANWTGAKSAGVKRGIYLPYYQGLAEGVGQQLYALLTASGGDFGELPVAVDVESGNSVWTLAQNKALQWLMWILQRLCPNGDTLYTSPGYWNAYVMPSCSGNPTPASTDNTWARFYSLWLATWTYDTSKAPIVPAPWSKATYWQYSNKGVGADYGCASATVDLDTDVAIVPPPVISPAPAISFRADRTSITAGQSVTLSWSVDNVAAVYLHVGSSRSGVGGHDQRALSPALDTDCYLEVLGRDGVTYTSPILHIAVAPAPAPTPSKPKLGYWVGFNGAAAGGAYNDGCRFFVHMNDTDSANALAARGDAFVIYRQYLDHAPGVDEMVGFLSGRLHPSIMRTGLCEMGHVDGTKFADRAAFDSQVATKLRAINPAYRYAAGTYSMGTPDFTQPSVCDAIRQYYAPGYNSGLYWWDHHLYSPDMEHIYNDAELIWYELRWQFLFTKCGFDPTVRHVICTETGVDQGGVGGFIAHNATNEQVVSWCKRWNEIQARPIVVNGKSYPSPFVGAAIFQLGDRGTQPGGWAGYNVEAYTAAIKVAEVYT